jgi:acyl-CoA dehydrogenase
MSQPLSEVRLTLEQVLARLEPIAEGVIAANAEAVDREARFPAETVAALGEAGLLGLVTPLEHGGWAWGSSRPPRWCIVSPGAAAAAAWSSVCTSAGRW